MAIGSSVYVLWAEGTHRFKIGWTKGSVDERAAQIMAMSPLPLRIVAEGDGTKQQEGWLHAQLHRFRAHGEWFVLPEDAVRWLLGAFDIWLPA